MSCLACYYISEGFRAPLGVVYPRYLPDILTDGRDGNESPVRLLFRKCPILKTGEIKKGGDTWTLGTTVSDVPHP
jgi:hypothetical protein